MRICQVAYELKVYGERTHAATMAISLKNCFFICPIGKESRLKQVIIVCTFEHVIAITSVYLKFKKVEKTTLFT